MRRREQISYDSMKQLYKNVKLMPDMVLAMNACGRQKQREGCLFCLRNDVERTLSDEAFHILLCKANEIFSKTGFTNTLLEHDVSVSARESELEAKLEEFRGAELIITDRLHGMIFSAITGTKCIVLNGKSPKIQGCYQWISQLGYIVLIDSVEEFEAAYHQMPEYPNQYNVGDMQQMFLELEKDLVSLVAEGKWH